MIGQVRVIEELNLYCQEIFNGSNYNILLRAQSGMGKTTVAFRMASVIGFKDCFYYLPENGMIIPIQTDKRIHIIDEIHTLENPEFLYPLMDSGRFSFIILTNESGSLKEPLKNRCINIIFERYAKEEYIKIFQQHLNYPESFLEYLLEYIRTPRDITVLSSRLNVINKIYGVPKDLEELKQRLKYILNLEGGLDEHSRTYLNFLNKIQRGSLSLLVAGTGIDKDTILTEIEPFLLYKGLIKITSRGREICL